MKLRLDGLRSRRSASPNLLLKLRDLRRACPAMGSVAGHAVKAVLRAIAVESTTFFWLNIVASLWL